MISVIRDIPMTRGTYYRFNKQVTTNEVCSLDIREIDKQYFVNNRLTHIYAWNSGESIQYRIETNKLIIIDNNQTIFLDKTRCNYGGFRYWFKCPKCNKRSGVLYSKHNNFFCRKCHKLPYPSQREHEVYQLMRKMKKIRKRLGASLNLSDPILTKPKSMHWKTFEYLRMKEIILSRKYAHAAGAYLGINLEC